MKYLFAAVFLVAALGCGKNDSSARAPAEESKITWEEYQKLAPEERDAQPILDRLDENAKAKLAEQLKKK